MKNTIYFLIGLLIPVTGYSQQNLPDDITSLVYTTYDGKNQMISDFFYKATSSFETINGRKTVFLVNEIPLNETNKEELNFLEIGEQNLSLSIKNMLPAFVLQDFNSMKIELGKQVYTLPGNLTLQTKLPDIDMPFSVSVAPIVHSLQYKITERTVTRKETINTPAGTFECFVITAKTQFIPKYGNTANTVQWFSTKIGLIKEIDYDESGAITGMTLLTALNDSKKASSFAQN